MIFLFSYYLNLIGVLLLYAGWINKCNKVLFISGGVTILVASLLQLIGGGIIA